MFPEAPIYQNEYLMSLLGINYQWLLFNMISNPLNSMYYIAMTFALIGSVVILIMPRFQTLKTIIPWLVLVTILIIGPYENDLFFSKGKEGGLNASPNNIVIPGHDALFATYANCNAPSTTNAGACTSFLNDVGITTQTTVGEATGSVKVIADENTPNSEYSISGFTPQLAIMHFTNKIIKALMVGFYGEDVVNSDNGVIPTTIADIAETEASTSDALSAKSAELQYIKNLYTNACSEYKDIALKGVSITSKQLIAERGYYDRFINLFNSDDRYQNIGYSYFTLNTAHKLNMHYYTFKGSSSGVNIYPVKAEGLIGFSSNRYTLKDMSKQLSPNNSTTVAMDRLNTFINTNTFGNIATEAFMGTSEYSPLRNKEVIINGYYGASATMNTSKVSQLQNQWIKANKQIINKKISFPSVLYKEPAEFVTNVAQGSDLGMAYSGKKLIKSWKLADTNSVDTWRRYRARMGDIIETKNGKVKAGYEDMMNLPVALRIPTNGTNVQGDPYASKGSFGNASNNDYNSTGSIRVTNCAEFHKALNDRYLMYMSSQNDVPINLNPDINDPSKDLEVKGNGSAGTYPIPIKSKNAPAHRSVSTAVNRFIAGYEDKNGTTPSKELVSRYISSLYIQNIREGGPKLLSGASEAGVGVEESADFDVFSLFSGGVAAIAGYLGGLVMEFMSWFIGVAAQLFYRFALALSQYGLAISLMITPIIYLMGLIIPGWSLNVILAPIAAVLYFKTVTISFTIIDFFIKMLSDAEILYSNGTIENALFTFIAAAGYMAAFAFAGFLLFGLGSAGALVQHLGSKMDSAAQQASGSASALASRPLIAAGTLGAGAAMATVKGTLAEGTRGRSLFSSETVMKDGKEVKLASALSVGLQEGGDVLRASSDALKSIPGVGPVLHEAFNAGIQSESRGKAMDAISYSNSASGSEHSYGSMSDDIKNRGYIEKEIAQLYKSGNTDAATQLSIDNLDMFNPAEQNEIMRRKMKVGGQAAGLQPTNAKDINGEAVFIDGFIDQMEAGSSVNNYAAKHNMSPTDAKKEIFNKLNQVINHSNNHKDGYKIASPKTHINGKTGEMDGGFQFSKEFKSRNPEGFNDLKQVLQDVSGKGKGFNQAGSIQAKDDGSTFFKGVSYVPPKGKGISAGGGKPPPPVGGGTPGPTRNNSGGGGGFSGGSGGGGRSNPVSPAQASSGIDGAKLGRDIAKGMKDSLGSDFKPVDGGTIAVSKSVRDDVKKGKDKPTKPPTSKK